MYVVTSSGKRLPVDDSSIDYENEYVRFQETVGLYSDCTTLKEIWILQLQKKTVHSVLSPRTYELELVKEIQYDHLPTEEEILWAMSAYGLSRWDVATIITGYELDIGDEE